MTSLFSPSRSNMIRRQYNSALKIKGLLFPVSQRTLSAANVRFVEQKNKYGGILSKIKKIFNPPEIRFREVELLPICCSKHKKRPRTQSRPLRKILANYSMENNLLGNNNNNNSYLKYIRIDKLLSEYMLAQSMRKKKMGLVSLGPVRGIMGLASYTSKPPITEPNMPPQQHKKDNKKDEKKRKKPVIKVDGKATRELEKDLLGLEPENYRCQWGVKLIETPVQEISAEEPQTPRYILQNSWGVKVKKVADTEGAATIGEKFQNSRDDEILKVPEQVVEAKTEQVTEKFQLSKTEDLGIAETKGIAKSEETFAEMKNPEKSIHFLRAKDAKPEGDAPKNSCVTQEGTTVNSSLSAPEDTTSDGDYNVPKGLPQNAEIIAWQDLVDRSKPPVDEAIEAQEVLAPLGPTFIRPEPPEPKLDIEAVKPVTAEKVEFRGFGSLDHKKSPTTDYASSKGIHTDSRLSASTGVETENPVKNYLVPNSEKVKENLVDPFIILGGKNKPELKKASEILTKEEQEETARKPRLPTKALTLRRINTDDMSYYNALEAKKVEETYGRMVEMELSSPSGIGDTILDAPLPTEVTISMKPASKRKIDSVIKCARSAFSSSTFSSRGSFFGGSSGSSGSRGRNRSNYLAASGTSKGKDRKPVKSTEEEEEDDDENHAPEGDYVRVPGDPYPYSREHFYKWRVSPQSDYAVYLATNPRNQNYGEGYNSGDFNFTGGYSSSNGYDGAGGYNSFDGYETANASSAPNADYNANYSYNASSAANYSASDASSYSADSGAANYNSDASNAANNYKTVEGYQYSNADYAENTNDHEEDKYEMEDYSNSSSNSYEYSTEYSNQAEDLEMDEDDQGDYYTKATMARETQVVQDGPVDTTPRDVAMKPNPHRSVKSKNPVNPEIAKRDLKSPAPSRNNHTENRELFPGNRNLDKARMNEDENATEGGKQAQVAKVYGQHNKNLCRQLSTIEKDDGWEFERMQFYKGQGLFHARLNDLMGQVVISSLDQHFVPECYRDNLRVKNFEKINELQC